MKLFNPFRCKKHTPVTIYYAVVGENVWVGYIPSSKHKIGSRQYKAEYARAMRALQKRVEKERAA